MSTSCLFNRRAIKWLFFFLLHSIVASSALANFASWNIQGANSGDINVYNAAIRLLFSVQTGAHRQVDIMAVQEAGVPPNANQVNPADRTPIDFIGTAANNPLYSVSEYVYHAGTERTQSTVRIFHQMLDVRARRVNNAIVIPENMAVDRIVVIPPAQGFNGARPLLGIIIRGRAYFTYHALSNGGNDARHAVANVQDWLNSNANGVNYAIIGGDFNRDPTRLIIPVDARIFRTSQATHNSGNELDYFVGLTRTGATRLVHRDAQIRDIDGSSYSDHRMVTMAPVPTANQNPGSASMNHATTASIMIPTAIVMGGFVSSK